MLLTSCFPTCVLFHQSPALILLYHEYSLHDFTCYISTCFCMLLSTTRFSRHAYDSVLSIHVCLSMHTTWRSHHHSSGTFDSPGFLCPSFGAWSMWIFPVADQSGAVEALIPSRPSRALSSQASCSVSSFLSWLVSAFWSVHNWISHYILAFAPIGDVIFL